jgi:hypothetical protein
MYFEEYLANLKAAQEMRKAALQRVLAAIQELVTAEAEVDQALAMPWEGGDREALGSLDHLWGELWSHLPQEVAQVLKFGDLF